MLFIRYIFSKVRLCGASFPDVERYPGREWVNAYIAAFFYCAPITVCVFRLSYQYAAYLRLSPGLFAIVRDFEVGGMMGWVITGLATLWIEIGIVGWGGRARRIADSVSMKYRLDAKHIVLPLISSLLIVYLTAVCLISQDPLFLLGKVIALYVVAGFAVRRGLFR